MLKKFFSETLWDCFRSTIWLILTTCYIIEDIAKFIGKFIRFALHEVLKGVATFCFFILILCEALMERLVR